MKKTALLILICIVSYDSLACEICGASAGNYFIGPFPQFKKHFVGVRYTFRSFNSAIATDATEFSKDFYQTAEIWTGINLGQKWQILGFIPYNINRQDSDEGTSQLSGLSDISLITNYTLLNISKELGISHRLWIGGGVKLPTGKFQPDANEELVPAANIQPGTGSFDWIINTLYALSFKEWGLNSTISYKINQSASAFQFGNRFHASAFLFRSTFTTWSTLNPNVGLLYEYVNANKFEGLEVEATGGQAFLASVGLETSVKRINLGFNIQLPIRQNFSDDQTKTKVRGMVNLTYNF